MSDFSSARGGNQIPAFCMMISGCADSQTSADCHDAAGQFCLPADAGPGGAGGACTTSLAWVLEKSGSQRITWVTLLKEMRSKLDEEGFEQIPQLSCSRQINIGQTFDILNGSRPDTAKALLVGINYVGQQGELRGCHNDVEVMQRLLQERGVNPSNMRLLLDDNQSEAPTHANILDGFRWLCEGASAGEARFFHYSGHGGSVRDENSDEADHKDETLIPVDYQSAGQILDDEIHEKLIMAMPKDVSLTCLMDCCHSGTILDLPYCIVMNNDTVSQVDAGEVPQMMPNPKFDAEKLAKIAQIAFQEFSRAPHTQAGMMSALMRCGQKIMADAGLTGAIKGLVGMGPRKSGE